MIDSLEPHSTHGHRLKAFLHRYIIIFGGPWARVILDGLLHRITLGVVTRMTYIIAEPCVDVKDGACVDVCPVDCIYTTDDDNMFYINPEECIDCAACEPVCPVTAIFAEDDVPEEWHSYIDKNYEYFGQSR